MFFAIQSQPKGVAKRRNMWSQVSHQPPMSKNSGDTGFGQWRSSKIQKSSFSPSFHSMGKSSEPWKVPSTSDPAVTDISLPLLRPAARDGRPSARAQISDNRLSGQGGGDRAGRTP